MLAIVLVLSAVTLGMIGLGLTLEGSGGQRLVGILCMAATPLGIWAATRVTPEGGTTGYFDKNI